MPIMHAGVDYLVNTQNPSSRIFTVVFQSKQASSSEHVILIADDHTFEGREDFRLRIVAVRFNGQAAALFRAQDGLTNTFVDVSIQDDDSKFKNSPCTICLQTITKRPMLIYILCIVFFSYTCQLDNVRTHSSD